MPEHVRIRGEREQHLDVLEEVGKRLADEEEQTLQEAAQRILDRAPVDESPPEDRLPEDLASSSKGPSA